MTNLSTTLVVAAAPHDYVKECLEELKVPGEEVTLVSTKKYRFSGIDSYLDVAGDMFSDSLKLPAVDPQNVIVIQYSRTITANLNIYKFLLANGLNEFELKTKSRDVVYTSAKTLLDSVHGSIQSPDSVYYISPASIKYCASLDLVHYGQTLPGDWDLTNIEFERDIPFFHSLKQRIENNLDWPLTAYYQDILASIKQGEVRFSCKSEQDLQARCSQLEKLYFDIKHNGWQQKDDEDYITVNIGRDGEVLFADGRHRLAIAKLLKLEKVPVKIAVRHSKWVEFKNEVQAYADELQGGVIYAPINHIDLQGVASLHDSERFNLIKQHIAKPESRILDIGSHWGRACAELEEAGHLCVAIEGSVTNYYYLERIKNIEKRKFESVCCSIFDYNLAQQNFDVVLALNIFHHFLKSETLYQSLIELLEKLKVKQLFLQTHATTEPQMAGAYKNYEGGDFCRFIIQHSCLQHFTLLDEHESGRRLYLLSE